MPPERDLKAGTGVTRCASIRTATSSRCGILKRATLTRKSSTIFRTTPGAGIPLTS